MANVIDIFKGLGVEIVLDNDNEFNIIKETLSRIGIASKKDLKLWQSVHILRKLDKVTGKPRYALLHFKELFKMDGRVTDFSDEDLMRRNTIIYLVTQQWGLGRLRNPELLPYIKEESFYVDDKIVNGNIKILSHKDKDEWVLEPKYNIGSKRNLRGS